MPKRQEYKRYTRSRAGNVLYFAFLFLAGAFSVLPMIYCVCTAFKPLDELLVFPPRFFVRRPTFENFLSLPSLLEALRVPVSRYLFNSVFTSVVSTVLHIFAASAAAFAFSKSKIKGRTVLFLIVQFSLLYNAYTLAVPQYLIFSNLHMIDTFWIYILPAIPSSMGAFLMKQYMDISVPDALLEAARIDGAGVFRMYARIVLPITKPAWMTLFLFSFRDMWSIIPGGTVFSEELKTLPYVMSSITAGGTARAGSAMAAAVILMIPPIIVYFISQSNVMETMSTAGIK
ncbi:MAG: carbohydrate ABC transporter permease [Oscillospiraceae bacterium]|jgi:ABC-type glycerol-3-phosphate transport system permease component|nr:carbohydrate ABC transporter permease [Oscillospiraceae bacterium]